MCIYYRQRSKRARRSRLEDSRLEDFRQGLGCSDMSLLQYQR